MRAASSLCLCYLVRLCCSVPPRVVFHTCVWYSTGGGGRRHGLGGTVRLMAVCRRVPVVFCRGRDLVVLFCVVMRCVWAGVLMLTSTPTLRARMVWRFLRSPSLSGGGCRAGAFPSPVPAAAAPHRPRPKTRGRGVRGKLLVCRWCGCGYPFVEARHASDACPRRPQLMWWCESPCDRRATLQVVGYGVCAIASRACDACICGGIAPSYLIFNLG